MDRHKKAELTADLEDLGADIVCLTKHIMYTCKKELDGIILILKNDN